MKFVPFRASIKDIRLFVAAYEEGAFTAAATRENATQSGVSRHIGRLEALLGVTLFVREQGGAIATPAADLFYRHAVDVLQRLDDAADDVAVLSRGYEGVITVGAIPSLTSSVMAQVLEKFAALHPNVKVRVVEAVTSLMAQMIKAGEIDFGFGLDIIRAPGIRARKLLTMTECLWFGPQENGDPLLRKLPDRPINFLWSMTQGNRYASSKEHFRAKGVRIGKEMEIDSALTALELVSRGAWSIVSPPLLLSPSSDSARFSLWPMRDPDVESALILFESTSRPLSRASQALVDAIAEMAREAQDAWTKKFAAAGLL
jgi:LysR family transcriptional regulator, nitrogen assimilation regulatory protein